MKCPKNCVMQTPNKVMSQTEPEQGHDEDQQVRVLSPSDHYLYDVPAPEARALLRARQADRVSADTIRLHAFSLPRWMRGTGYVRLVHSDPHDRPAQEFQHEQTGTIRQYPAQQAKRRAHWYEHTPISTSDRPVFLEVLASCIASRPKPRRAKARRMAA